MTYGKREQHINLQILKATPNKIEMGTSFAYAITEEGKVFITLDGYHAFIIQKKNVLLDLSNRKVFYINENMWENIKPQDSDLERCTDTKIIEACDSTKIRKIECAGKFYYYNNRLFENVIKFWEGDLYIKIGFTSDITSSYGTLYGLNSMGVIEWLLMGVKTCVNKKEN